MFTHARTRTYRLREGLRAFNYMPQITIHELRHDEQRIRSTLFLVAGYHAADADDVLMIELPENLELPQCSLGCVQGVHGSINLLDGHIFAGLQVPRTAVRQGDESYRILGVTLHTDLIDTQMENQDMELSLPEEVHLHDLTKSTLPQSFDRFESFGIQMETKLWCSFLLLHLVAIIVKPSTKFLCNTTHPGSLPPRQ